MTTTQNSSQGKLGNIYPSPAIGTLTVKSLKLVSSDITTWKNAVDAARSAISPRRQQLYDLYHNIALDGHLASVAQKRTIAITNQKIQWVADGGDVNAVDLINKEVLDTPWFNNFLKCVMETISWGHSLMELHVQNGLISKVELINRYNVMPEYGFVSYHYNNYSPSTSTGMYYRDEPRDWPYLIEIGGPKDYGLYMIAAPYVLYKRSGIADWAQFAEIFGMPFRVGKYNPFDDRTRQLLEQGLDNMGAAAWAVIPEGTSLEFHDSNGTGKSEVFKDLHAVMNEEISKLYLGGTMTIEDGASRAQGQVHSEGEDDINLADMIWVEHIINHELRPRLAKLMKGGGVFLTGKFRFPETGQIPLEKRITIDMQLSQRIPFPEDYWYKTYGIDKPKGAGVLLPIANNPYATTQPDEIDPEPAAKDVKKKKPGEPMAVAINAMYGKHLHAKMEITAADKKKRDEIWDRVVKGLHDGTIKPGKIDKELHGWIADRLLKGVTTGFGGDLEKYDPQTPDHIMLEKLNRDVQVFSAFKTHQELRDATDLLTDENGFVRSFNDFKQAVQAIDQTYNITWLASEYQQAIASAQMASKWVNFQSNKETLPLLKYTTAGDDRVRVDHAKLDGIIKPIDDEFWDTYYPPNDWGCRCDIDQLEEGAVTETDPDQLPVLKPMFQANTAAQGTVFPEKHPYYKVQKQYEKAAARNFGINIPDVDE